MFTFCLGIHKNGVYIDDFRKVSHSYLTGMFWFDMCTSIPVSYIEYFALLKCDDTFRSSSMTRDLDAPTEVRNTEP